MPTVPAGKIQLHRKVNRDDFVCGTCGCVVAEEHIAVHEAFHAAVWTQATVTHTAVANQPGGF
jgi:transcription initiation factor TFIIIB Brf1 subunit/transcription initiation factor TFIIB